MSLKKVRLLVMAPETVAMLVVSGDRPGMRSQTTGRRLPTASLATAWASSTSITRVPPAPTPGIGEEFGATLPATTGSRVGKSVASTELLPTAMLPM